MHFCSMPMYLVAITIPSTMGRRPTPLIAMQPHTIIFRGCFAVRFMHSCLYYSPENLLTYTYVLAWLPNRQKVLSSLNRAFTYILQTAAEVPTGFSCASGHQSSAASCVPCTLLDQTTSI